MSAVSTTWSKIKPWRADKLVKDLAVGDKTIAQLAEEHDVSEVTIYRFKKDNADTIDAVIQGWVENNEHLWPTRKETRIMFLLQRVQDYQDRMDVLIRTAQRATEQMREIDPDADEVPVDGSEYRAYAQAQERILNRIADECGQGRMPVPASDAAAAVPYTVKIVGVDVESAFPVQAPA